MAYLTLVQLAESLGVDEGVVANWVRQEGLPCVTDRGRLLFDRTLVIAWAAKRGLAAKAGFLAPNLPSSAAGGRLESMLRAGGVWRDVPAATTRDLFEKIVAKLPGATVAVQELLTQRIHAPDGISWAAVGEGLALPHLRSPVALGPDSGVVAILLLRDPLTMIEAAPDRVPVTRLLFFVAPTPRAHLELLAHLTTALTRGSLRQLLVEGAPDADFFAAFASRETGAAKESKR